MSVLLEEPRHFSSGKRTESLATATANWDCKGTESLNKNRVVFPSYAYPRCRACFMILFVGFCNKLCSGRVQYGQNDSLGDTGMVPQTPIYIPAYMHASRQTGRQAGMHTCLHAYVHLYIDTYTKIYISWVRMCICTYVLTYLPAYAPTDLPTYLHTYISTGLPTYLAT